MSTPDLTAFRGNWVAVASGKLVAHHPTLDGIMKILEELGTPGRGCQVWFEQKPEDVMLWSVQYPSRPGYVYPNCLFASREQAQWWIDSWRNSGQEVGTIWTRDARWERWRPADEPELELPSYPIEKPELDTVEVPATVEPTRKPRYGRATVNPDTEPPDHNCTCRHGGVEAEDHLPGNGCERRDCTCLYWPS